ncbi:hypothetical protein [Macrococcoides canis]|uniref:Uncharacterized protein n=1 Tax=Macrococcoides canis TaxID=1855823 RepID=A0A4R6C6U0_9STAP|nr:hypothetical protein [Macrococcus canis]TDM18029.1 hypothetical protein ETI04_00655 [Macrococcus canis]
MIPSNVFITEVLKDILLYNMPQSSQLDRLSVVLTNLHTHEFIEVVPANKERTKAKYRLTEKGYALLMYSLKFN